MACYVCIQQVLKGITLNNNGLPCLWHSCADVDILISQISLLSHSLSPLVSHRRAMRHPLLLVRPCPQLLSICCQRVSCVPSFIYSFGVMPFSVGLLTIPIPDTALPDRPDSVPEHRRAILIRLSLCAFDLLWLQVGHCSGHQQGARGSSHRWQCPCPIACSPTHPVLWPSSAH